jgi:tryptophan-rich sensory protein
MGINLQKINVKKLVLSLLVSEGAGIFGSLFTVNAINTWYVTLNKPFFSPPNWVFGPVWTLLFALMGVSLYIVWNKKIDKKVKAHAMSLFFKQLFLNFLWSIFFFTFKNPAAGLVEIVIMWYFIFETIKAFKKIDTTSAYLLYPYLAWVSFATLLNFAIFVLN